MQHHSPSRRLCANLARISLACLLSACVFCAIALSIPCAQAQNLAPEPSHRQAFTPSDSDDFPDANDRMLLNADQASRKNFDAINALRSREIKDEATRLLILSGALKKEIDMLGDKPMTERMRREANVIEILAHDVRKKMSLTVGGG
jgi:hypothetical protein